MLTEHASCATMSPKRFSTKILIEANQVQFKDQVESQQSAKEQQQKLIEPDQVGKELKDLFYYFLRLSPPPLHSFALSLTANRINAIVRISINNVLLETIDINDIERIRKIRRKQKGDKNMQMKLLNQILDAQTKKNE